MQWVHGALTRAFRTWRDEHYASKSDLLRRVWTGVFDSLPNHAQPTSRRATQSPFRFRSVHSGCSLCDWSHHNDVAAASLAYGSPWPTVFLAHSLFDPQPPWPTASLADSLLGRQPPWPTALANGSLGPQPPWPTALAKAVGQGGCGPREPLAKAVGQGGCRPRRLSAKEAVGQGGCGSKRLWAKKTVGQGEP